MLLNKRRSTHVERSNQLRQDQVSGIYVPKESRMEQKLGFSSAHFSLGRKNDSKYTYAPLMNSNLIFSAFLSIHPSIHHSRAL